MRANSHFLLTLPWVMGLMVSPEALRLQGNCAGLNGFFCITDGGDPAIGNSGRAAAAFESLPYP